MENEDFKIFVQMIHGLVIVHKSFYKDEWLKYNIALIVLKMEISLIYINEKKYP